MTGAPASCHERLIPHMKTKLSRQAMPQAILINHSTTENLQPHENKTGPKEMPYECHEKGQIQRNGKRSDQGVKDELHSLNKRY